LAFHFRQFLFLGRQRQRRIPQTLSTRSNSSTIQQSKIQLTVKHRLDPLNDAVGMANQLIVGRPIKFIRTIQSDAA
jgi:hypothetical protein